MSFRERASFLAPAWVFTPILPSFQRPNARRQLLDFVACCRRRRWLISWVCPQIASHKCQAMRFCNPRTCGPGHARTVGSHCRPLPSTRRRMLSANYTSIWTRAVSNTMASTFCRSTSTILGLFVDSQAAWKKDTSSCCIANSHSSAGRPAGEVPSRLGMKPQIGFSSGQSRLRGCTTLQNGTV